jgi:hypothetical protein
MKVAENYNIVIEGRGLEGTAKDSYEAKVIGMVHGIGATRAGKILLHWIKNSGTHRDWVLIAPYSQAAQYGVCNAIAWDDLWPVQIGTREVMASKVNFSPETFMHATCHLGLNFTPLEVLVHELVHAQRHVTRIAKDVPLTGPLAGYENEEEFFAVMFTNVWSSTHSLTSVSRDGLRSDHGTGRLATPNDDSDVFMTNRDNYRLIKKYCSQQPKMTRELADIQVKFNPFRTYYTWKAKNIEIR